MTQPTEDSHIPRKLFHVVWASIIPTVYYFEFLPRHIVVLATVAITFTWLTFEIVRLKSPVVNNYFQRHFASLMKKKEAVAFTGVTYMLIGTSVSLAAFTPDVASAALYFIAFGDPIAAIIGKALGGVSLANGKTLSGSVAMLITCMSVGSILIGFGPLVFSGALAGTMAELFTNRFDDNLVVPIASGATMTLIGTF